MGIWWVRESVSQKVNSCLPHLDKGLRLLLPFPLFSAGKQHACQSSHPVAQRTSEFTPPALKQNSTTPHASFCTCFSSLSALMDLPPFLCAAFPLAFFNNTQPIRSQTAVASGSRLSGFKNVKGTAAVPVARILNSLRPAVYHRACVCVCVLCLVLIFVLG